MGMRHAPAAVLFLALTISTTRALTLSAPPILGESSGAISGIAVADPRYELDSAAALAGVTFTIAGPPPTTVRARVSGSGRYYDCAVRLDGRWRCPLGGVPVGEADALSVVASA
jgi:hypothetical protein